MAKTVKSMLAEAHNLEAKGQMEQAEQIHTEIVKAEPGALPSWRFLGAQALTRGDHKAAMHAIRQYQKIDQLAGDAWQGLGICFIHLKDWVGARKVFEEAVKLQPSNNAHLLFLGEAARNLRENDLAMDCFSLAFRHSSQQDIETEIARAEPLMKQILVAAMTFMEAHSNNTTIENSPAQLGFLKVSLDDAIRAEQFCQEGEKTLNTNGLDGNNSLAKTAFASALALNPDNKKALGNQMELAFRAGANEDGLNFLRRYASLSASHAATQYRLAVVEEQIGTAENAEEAYLRSLRADPTNILTHLYAGFFFENKDGDQEANTETAAQIYSLGYTINNKLIDLHRDTSVDEETRRRSYSASLLLGKKMAELHEMGATKNGGRILNAVWPQTHNGELAYREKTQRPHEFYIPDISPIRFMDRSQMPWAKQVEAAFGDIKTELVAALSDEQIEGRPYLDANMQLGSEFKPILGTMNWVALDLYRDGIPNEEILAKFPKTAAALEAAPLTAFGEHPFEIFFSLLKPHQHIPPHFGLSNHGITVHLPIIVPPKCKIRVDDEWREWKEGQLLAFDDSFDHEARNDSDELRVVLLFEIWHPDLTDAEKEAICGSFNERQIWLDARKIPNFK